MRVLVTGATGFLGRAIAAEAADKTIEIVRVGGTYGSACEFNVNVGSAQDVARLASAGKVDAVVHTAGIAHRFGNVPDEEYERINVEGAANVARLAVKLGARHFVHVSSVLVYGRPRNVEVIDESFPCAPEDAYARSKADGESSVVRICEEAGIPVTIFRPAPMIGEGSRGNFFRLIRAIDTRRFIWLGKGENLKSALYVGDAARAIRSVLENKNKDRGTEVFNLAAPAVKVNMIVGTITEALNKSVPKMRIPARMPLSTIRAAASLLPVPKIKAVSNTLEKWLSTEIYSTASILAAYGFSPELSIPEALKREVAAYRAANPQV
jgi:UDP-glucose 4-epimerase